MSKGQKQKKDALVG